MAEKVVNKVKIDEQKSDFAYGQSQPYEARLATLEEIRREYHRWKYGGEPPFERVARFVRLKPLDNDEA